MIILGIRPLETDHADAMLLTKTRIAKELGISVGTFTKYFIKTDDKNKPKATIYKGRLRYSEREINNFLYNHVIPFYKHMALLESKPTKPISNKESQYYTLENKYEIKTFKA